MQCGVVPAFENFECVANASTRRLRTAPESIEGIMSSIVLLTLAVKRASFYDFGYQ